MKVLFILAFLEMYGANTSTLNLMKALRKHHKVVPIVLVPSEGDLTKELAIEGIEYIVKPFRRSFVPMNFKNKRDILTKYIVQNRQVTLEMKLEIERLGGIDLVHSSTSVIDIGYYISRRYHIPHIWHVRESGDDYGIKYLLPRCMVSHMYRKSDAIIAISNYIEEVIWNKLRVKDNVTMIYNGVNEVQEKIVQSKFRHKERIQFCIVGAVQPLKNQKDVVYAAHELYKRIGNCFDLTIVGAGKTEELEKYIEQHQLQECIHLIGYQKEVYKILNNMDVGIMASNGEAFGRVTVEYMMNGLPVIASDSGANRELVQEKKNGLCFEVHNITELCSCMKYYIDEPQECERMGKYAYEYAKSKFTTEKNANAIYGQYEDIYLKWYS